jgi:parallel beta-helix repeat protein
MIRRSLLGALLVTVAVAVAGPGPAGATVTSLTSCGTISSPGSYRLDADVTAPPVNCFDIVASDVSLALNGHTIQGAALGSNVGVDAVGPSLKLHGPGTISGYFIGVLLHGRCFPCTSADNARVTGLTTTDNEEAGIRVNTSGNKIIGNVTAGNRNGIDVVGTGNAVIGNYAHDNRRFDLLDENVDCDSNTWKGNDFGTSNLTCIH